MLLQQTPREIEAGTGTSPFFNSIETQPIHNLSSELYRNHLGLMCFGSLVVEEAYTDSDHGVAIATGPLGDTWNWTMYFRNQNSRSMLVNNIPLSDLKESGPTDKLQPLWQHLSVDHQGRLWRQDFVSDREHLLAGLIIRAFNSSRVFKGAERLHQEKVIASDLHEDKEAYYYGDTRTPAHRHIGYVGGLGLKSTTNVASVLANPGNKLRDAVPVEALPDFILTVIKNLTSTFISKASILDPEDPTRNKVLSLDALIESSAS